MLAAKAEGNQAELHRAIERLSAVAPRWRQDPRGELAHVIIDAGIVDRLARDLGAAGMPLSADGYTDGQVGMAN